MTRGVLQSVVADLRERDGVEPWLVENVTVGDAAVLVELAAGNHDEAANQRAAGLAHRPSGEWSDAVDVSDPTELLGPLLGSAPTRLGGGAPDKSYLDRAVAIATLNALSAPHIDWETGDPMARLAPDISTIVTVGLFQPAFRKFADVDVRVIERMPVDAQAVSAPDGVSVESFAPADTDAAMAGAEVVFVTGSALVYGGIEDYVSAAPAAATVVVVGATASMLPTPLFDTGVDIVAGAAVEAIPRVREAVSAGACGTDLHDNGVRKGFVSRTRATGFPIHPEPPNDSK